MISTSKFNPELDSDVSVVRDYEAFVLQMYVLLHVEIQTQLRSELNE
jgi:hypothetical protein